LPISLPRWSAILPGMLQLNVQSLATLLPQWLRQAPSLLAGSFFGGAGVGSSTTLAKTIQGVLGNLPRSQEALTAALDRVVLRLDQLGLDRVAAILRQV
jgi:hypothetical protein